MRSLIKQPLERVILGLFHDIQSSQMPINQKILIKKYGEKRFNIFKKYYFADFQDLVIARKQEDGAVTLELTRQGFEYYLTMKREYDNKIVSRLNLQLGIGSSIFAVLLLMWDKTATNIKSPSIITVIVWSIMIMGLFMIATTMIFNALAEYVTFFREN